MLGEVFILHKNGWACSNEAQYDVEKDFEDNVIKTTYTLKVKGLFNGKGEIIKDISLSLIFRNEKGEKIAFSGNLRSVTDKKTTFVLTGRDKNIEVINKILNKIKEETNNGR